MSSKTLAPRYGLSRIEVAVLCALACIVLPLFVSCTSRPADTGQVVQVSQTATTGQTAPTGQTAMTGQTASTGQATDPVRAANTGPIINTLQAGNTGASSKSTAPAFDLIATQQQTECKFNMKKLAFAIHQYHDVYKRLPPSSVAATPGQFAVNANWHFLLLPYVGETELYKHSLTSQDSWEAVVGDMNTPLRAVPIRTYCCPADESITEEGYPGNRDRSWAATSYLHNYLLFGGNHTGVSHLPRYKLGSIPDGTAQTIAITEGYGGGQGKLGHLWAHGNSDLGLAPQLGAAGNWSQVPQLAVPQSTYDQSRAGTWHKTGCMLALADGSVRSISPRISQLLWQNACTPDDGNVLPPNFLD